MPGKVTRDLAMMIQQSKNANLYEQIKADKAYKDFADGKLLEKIEESEQDFIEAYQGTKTMRYEIMDFLDSSIIGQGISIINNAAQTVASITSKITPWKFDNLMVNLWDQFDTEIKDDYNMAKEYYNSTKEQLWDLMIQGMEDLEALGQIVREDTMFYHIGTVQDDQLRIFQIDSSSMHQLEKDKKLFDLSIEESTDKDGDLKYAISLQSKWGSKNDMIHALEKMIKGENDNSELILTEDDQSIWSLLASTNIYSKTDETKQIGYGRKFEIFDELYSAEQGDIYLEDILANGYYLDTLSWMAGGDVSYNGNSYQDKFITNAGKFNISSLASVKEGLEFYMTLEQSEEEFLSGFWEPINKMRDQTDSDITEENADIIIEDSIDEQEESLIDQVTGVIDEELNEW